MYIRLIKAFDKEVLTTQTRNDIIITMIRTGKLNKGLIIVNAYEVLPAVQHMVDRLAAEFAALKIEIEVKTNAEILSYIGSDGELYSADLQDDFCIFLDKDLYTSHLLEQAGIRLFNSADAIEACDDKMLTYMRLLHFNIAMPKTVPGPLHYGIKNNEAFLTNLPKVIPFPIVCKEDYGSMGQNVYLAANAEDLKSIEQKITLKPRLFQELIKSSWGLDYRLIVIGGRFKVGMRRRSLTGDFRSNIALGGVGEAVQIPDEYIHVAERVAAILKLDYCGVDLLEGLHGEPILCEVNSNAFIQGIEQVTKYNVAAEYAKYIYKQIYLM
jgi:gamma-F420-2:alpha-L-glutamate ligase